MAEYQWVTAEEAQKPTFENFSPETGVLESVWELFMGSTEEV